MFSSNNLVFYKYVRKTTLHLYVVFLQKRKSAKVISKNMKQFRANSTMVPIVPIQISGT